MKLVCFLLFVIVALQSQDSKNQFGLLLTVRICHAEKGYGGTSVC